MRLDHDTVSGSRGHALDDYFELKTRIHDRLLDLLDLSLIDSLDQHLVKSQIRTVVQRILEEQAYNVPLNLTEKENLFTEIEDEVLGLGPLEPFLKDDTIADVLINTYNQIFIERFGKLELSESRFKDDTHLMKIIDKIVSSGSMSLLPWWMPGLQTAQESMLSFLLWPWTGPLCLSGALAGIRF